MRRFGIRAALLLFWLGLAASGFILNSSGRRPLPSADCRDYATIASAEELRDAGQHDAATELLVARSKATVADDDKGISAVGKEELACISQMLIVVRQVSFSDRIADGVDDVVRSASGIGAQAPIDGEPVESSVGIDSWTRSVIRVLVWLLPLLGLLYTMRELLVIRRDRQPGPIQVKPVAADASQADLPITRFQARLTAYLADVDLTPPTITVGGIGELVIPVIEAAETSGSSNLKAVGKLAKGLLAPEPGSEVEVVLAGTDSSWAATVQVRTRRRGVVQSIERLTDSSWEDLAVQVAAHVYIVVFGFGPVKRRTPGWSRWSDTQQLAKYIEAVPNPELADLKELSEAEPSNLNVRLQLANAHWRLAEEATHRKLQGGNATPQWAEAASNHLQAVTATSLTAVRLAGRLVEPWVNLGLSLTQAGDWVAPSSGTIKVLKAWLRDDRSFRFIYCRFFAGMTILEDLKDLEPRDPAERRTQDSHLLHLAATILTAAGVRTLVIPIWWRWLHPHLRSSIPASSLLPFSRRRVSTILMLKAIRQYSLIRRKVSLNSRRAITWHRFVLWTIRLRLLFHPPSASQFVIRYNLALCYGWLGHLHEEEPSWAKEQFRNQLFGAHFRASDVVPKSRLQRLANDPDLENEPAKSWTREWLDDMGLTATPKPAEDRAWTVLHKTAQAKAEAWEQELHTALGLPTGGPAGLLATRRLHDLVEQEAAALKSANDWIGEGVERTAKPKWAASDHKRKLPTVDRSGELLADTDRSLIKTLLDLDTTELTTAAATGQPLQAEKLIAVTRVRYQTWGALIAELENPSNP